MAPSTQVLLNLADSLIKSGQLEQAANTLEQVIKIEPSANAHERLGFVNFRLRKYDESKAAFLTALDIDPNHYPSLNGAAVCYLNAFEFDKNDTDRQEAVKLLRRSLTLKPDQPRFKAFLDKYRLPK